MSSKCERCRWEDCDSLESPCYECDRSQSNFEMNSLYEAAPEIQKALIRALGGLDSLPIEREVRCALRLSGYDIKGGQK